MLFRTLTLVGRGLLCTYDRGTSSCHYCATVTRGSLIRDKAIRAWSWPLTYN